MPRPKAIPETAEPVTPDLQHDGIDSVSDDELLANLLAESPSESVFTEFEASPSDEAGSLIDAAVADDDEGKLNTRPFGKRRRKDDSGAKGTAPNAAEWEDFFSRIVIRFLTEWYVDIAFRGIDEDLVTEQDAAKLLLTEDERNVIARPFAEYANKNPFLRKHGRQIVAFADSFESVVILGQWFSRVNRVARKYNKIGKTTVMRGKAEHSHGDSGQSAASANGHATAGYGVYNPGSG